MSSTDFYRQRLAHAKWTWRETKGCRHKWRTQEREAEVCPFHGRGHTRRKDRIESRVEKHRARALERREIGEQLA